MEAVQNAAAAMVMSESDDDDDEPQLNAVESYYFVDSTNDNEPVCFSTLPFLFGDTDDLPDCKKRLVLRGTGGDPGVKVYSEVVAWSLGLEGKQPQFAVLTAEGRRWVRLVRPLNSYEEMIRTVLITAHMLHFLMRKPHEPERTLWNHLCKVFKYISWHTLLRLFFGQMVITDAYTDLFVLLQQV